MTHPITGADAQTVPSMLLPGHTAGTDDQRITLPPVPIIYENLPAEPTRWEYRCLIIDPQRETVPREEELNKLGADGWALAGVLDQSRSASQPFIYFYLIRAAQNA